MKQLINDFRDYNEKLNKSVRTIESYDNELVLFAEEYGDFKKLGDLDFCLNTWMDDMRKRFKPNTINKKKIALSSFSNYLVMQGIIESNVIKTIGKVKVDKTKFELYEKDDLNRMLELLDEKCNKEYKRKIDKQSWLMRKVIINLIYSTAIRNEECTRIRLSEIESDGTIGIHGKGHKDQLSRYCKMNNNIKDMMDQWLEIRNNMEVKPGNEDICFVSPLTKEAIHTNGVRKIIRDLKKELGIESDCMCHSLRHQKATELLAKGAKIEQVSKYLGHSSISTTEHFYVHQDKSTLDELANL